MKSYLSLWHNRWNQVKNLKTKNPRLYKLIVVLFILIIINAIHTFIRMYTVVSQLNIQAGEIEQTIEIAIQSNTAIPEYLGTIPDEVRSYSISIQEIEDTMTASVKLELIGTKDTGKIESILMKKDEIWEVKNLVLIIDSQEYNIKEPQTPEK